MVQIPWGQLFQLTNFSILVGVPRFWPTGNPRIKPSKGTCRDFKVQILREIQAQILREIQVQILVRSRFKFWWDPGSNPALLWENQGVRWVVWAASRKAEMWRGLLLLYASTNKQWSWVPSWINFMMVTPVWIVGQERVVIYFMIFFIVMVV